MRAVAIGAAAAVIFLLPGCLTDIGLRDYTPAGYSTPDGYEYPDPSSAPMPEGVAVNPEWFDATEFPLPLISNITVEKAYFAQLQPILATLRPEGEQGPFVGSFVFRFTGTFKDEQREAFRQKCDQMGWPDETVFLENGDVLSIWQWTDDTQSKAIGEHLVDNVQSRTGASELC